ncbi:sigma-70 family RNA polymerase sigma factor [Colwellia sp. UCD-KL20]|uniref:sigma-70 family RNA polymerase sigma factor n=1 Tax=Colwellia sp. UCD-KL20 TaxID=1917165 RepID=UPI000970FC2F|nr:sigma-70 family RNA polymerase sigma factor [Colwellia sp. UCD-KL20]
MQQSHRLFSSFIQQYQAGLRAYIRSLGVLPHSVDDIAQESFIVAYKSLPTFDHEKDFGHWLRGIARNLVRNELRKNSRQHRIIDESLTHFLIMQAELNQKVSSIQEADIKALSECLHKLPDKNRQLINKRYNEECNANVLAQDFNMTATAVRLSLMRIRNTLKICIAMRLNHDQ